MKKIINSRKTLMSDMLQGYALAYPDKIKLINGNTVCSTKTKPSGSVGILVANGSGHEPAMIELVGEGLIDVNLVGNIFAAPSGEEIFEALKYADFGAGVLILVSSHAGDIMNARIGIELAKEAGIDARMAVLWDDVFSAPKGEEEERRGTAGLFFAWKTVCAAAQAGASMDECIRIAEKTRDSTRTLTVAIDGGTHPETGGKMFDLPQDEVEVGMGVHGEAGTGRRKLTTARELSSFMLKAITEDMPFVNGDRVAVLLNNCGALTCMEMYTVYKEIAEYLDHLGIAVVRNWVGTYVTTQEMAGFAISLCKMDDELLKLYDAPSGGILSYRR